MSAFKTFNTHTLDTYITSYVNLVPLTWYRFAIEGDLHGVRSMFVRRKAGNETLATQRTDRRGDPTAIYQYLEIARAGLGAIDLELHRPPDGAVGYVLHAYGSSTGRIAVYGTKARQRAVAIARSIGRAVAIALRDDMLAGLLHGLRIAARLVGVGVIRMGLDSDGTRSARRARDRERLVWDYRVYEGVLLLVAIHIVR